MPNVAEYPNHQSFREALTDEGDAYLVCGLGTDVVLVPLEDSPAADRITAIAMQRFELKHCGCVGLTPDGTILFVKTNEVDQRDAISMGVAISRLANMECFETRRQRTKRAIGWLDSLYALDDTRPESGADHA